MNLHRKPPATNGARHETAGLSIFDGRPYLSGYTDEDVERMAVEDALAGVHDASVWGENAAHVRGVELINAAHDVNLRLICVALRADAQALVARLEPCREQAVAAERAAVRAIEADADALRRHPNWPADAGGEVQAACERHAELVSSHNALLGELEALLAQAGHHVEISAADAIRQGILYARRIQLAQPEPVTERLLPDRLPQPQVPDRDALLGFMLGITRLPLLERLSTVAVAERRDEAGEPPVREAAA